MLSGRRLLLHGLSRHQHRLLHRQLLSLSSRTKSLLLQHDGDGRHVSPLLGRRAPEVTSTTGLMSVVRALSTVSDNNAVGDTQAANETNKESAGSSRDVEDDSELELEASLLDCVSAPSAFVTSLISNVTSKHFRLESLKSEVASLQYKRHPLPQSLDKEMWHLILSLEQRRSRTFLLLKLSEVEWGLEWTPDKMQKREQRLNNIDHQQLRQDIQNIKLQDETWNRGLDLSMSSPVVREAFDTLKEHERSDFESKMADVEAAYNKCRQMGEQVPLQVSANDLLYLLKSCESEKQIASTFGFLAKTEAMEIGDLLDKRAKRYWGPLHRYRVQESRRSNEHLIYALGHNIPMIRVRDSTMTFHDSWREAMAFHSWGVPLIIDLQFVKDMEWRKIKSMLHKEITMSIANNRMYKEPFALYFCNVDLNDEKTKVLLKAIPNLLDSPIHVTEKSYTELFPRQNLLYLSPHSRCELNEVNYGQDVYIIGGCFSNNQYSLITAKRDKIRHARLPLRRVVGMNAELNVDHMVGFMQELKRTGGDFVMASRWIPPRKFKANSKAQGGSDIALQALYLVHKELALVTSDPWTKVNISPKQYKRMHEERLRHYIKVLETEGQSFTEEEEDDLDVYKMDTRGESRRQKRTKSFRSFL